MPDDPNDDGQGTDPTPDHSSKTFTQDDVNRIVEDRLKRERSKYSDYDDLKAKADKLKEFEDQNKGEVERLNERLTAAEKRATEAESQALRSDVATEKGLTAAQAKRLTGSTKEELESDADELLEAFGTKKFDDEGSKDDSSRRPKERLRPGAASDEEPEKSPDELADAVIKKSRGY